MASSSERDLIELLCVEIYMDGGSTRVTDFGDFYDKDKKITRLLKRCQSRKLLSFLESKPDFFHVSDRTNPPHIVTLKKLGSQNAQRALKGKSDADRMCLLQATAAALEERVAYVLRQRISKMFRRAQRQPNGDMSVCAGPVPVAWVSRKCSNDLHRYSRLLYNRPVAVLPQSDKWIDEIVSIFVTFFMERSPSLFVVSIEKKDGGEPLAMVDLCPKHKAEAVKILSSGKCGTVDSVNVEAVAARVSDLLRNLAPVGGVQLGRLLSDSKLRSLLGGIDLLMLIQANPSLFDEVSIFRDEMHSQWFITLKWKKCLADVKEIVVDENSTIGFGELVADEVGIYSLTNPQIAMAMAKIMRNVLIGNTGKHVPDAKLVKNKVLPDTVAIDLTSGIGGNTIALAKVFPKVIGYEINNERFNLLSQNVKKKLGVMSSKVLLKCGDSMNALSEISSQYRGEGEEQSPICVMVDPPWGGMNYRRKCCDDEMRLGEDMPISRVVSLVAQYLAPVTIGMKLPLQFQVQPFLDRLRSLPSFCSTSEYEASEDGTHPPLRVATIKKMGKQLFLVLELR